jgi:hypothetical protein
MNGTSTALPILQCPAKSENPIFDHKAVKLPQNALKRVSSQMNLTLKAEMPSSIGMPQSLLSELMLAEKIRRLFVMFLTLALTAGLGVHSIPMSNLGAHGAPKLMMMAMGAATDMPMPCKSDGCAGDEKGLMPAACAAFCSSVAAAPVLPILFDAVPIATMWPPKGTALTGLAGPPDPYPPRPTRMS